MLLILLCLQLQPWKICFRCERSFLSFYDFDSQVMKKIVRKNAALNCRLCIVIFFQKRPKIFVDEGDF